MIIDRQQMNPLEERVYQEIIRYSKEESQPRIVEAAERCGCSPSKVSKLLKKMGFRNFKSFVAFAKGETAEPTPEVSERKRLCAYLEQPDNGSVDALLEQILHHSKIILLGLGPSAYCAQYMEYKLRLLLPNKLILAFSDLVSANTFVDADTLLVVFSTTGHFTSFGELFDYTRSLGGTTVLVVEEFNVDLVSMYENDRIIFLTETTQPSHLKFHEKSRAATFIYIEEVLFQLMAQLEK